MRAAAAAIAAAALAAGMVPGTIVVGEVGDQHLLAAAHKAAGGHGAVTGTGLRASRPVDHDAWVAHTHS